MNYANIFRANNRRGVHILQSCHMKDKHFLTMSIKCVISQSGGCACPKNPHPKNGSFLSIRAPIFRSPRNFDNIRAPKFRSPRNFDGARASIFAHLFAFRSQTRFAPLHFALPRNPLTQEIRAPKKSAHPRNPRPKKIRSSVHCVVIQLASQTHTKR